MIEEKQREGIPSKRPKRRRSKDNPYTLFVCEGRYFVTFIDGEGKRVKAELSEEQFLLFDQFELEDKKQANERERHFEASDQTEISLEKRASISGESVEDSVLHKLDIEKLYLAIQCLLPMHRRRIVMYFFDGMTHAEIAQVEGCSKGAVKRSIDRAIEELKKFFEI